MRPPTWEAFILLYVSLGLADDHLSMRITTPKSKECAGGGGAVKDSDWLGATVGRHLHLGNLPTASNSLQSRRVALSVHALSAAHLQHVIL